MSRNHSSLDQLPSRPDYDEPEGDRHGRWTSDTPTSLRRLKAQKQELHQERVQAREQVRARKPIRTEPNAKERKQARELSRAGLVRTPEEQQRRRSGLDRRMLQKGTAWLPPVEDVDRGRHQGAEGLERAQLRAVPARGPGPGRRRPAPGPA
jgi:hypothetical protein